MSVQVKHRRDTAANIVGFTPAQGELIVDTTNNRVIIGDGTTAGGWPAAKLSEIAVASRTPVSDANYQVLSTDRIVAFTALSAARTVVLCPAAAFPAGTVLRIVDETGACSPAKAITITHAGSDSINGGASVSLLSAYASVALESNASGAWTVVEGGVGATLVAAASPNGATMTLNVLEQLVSGLSGASVTTPTPIPAGARVDACSMRVVATITGATSFSVGYAGSPSAFGAGLGVAAGSTNEGMIGPNPFYSTSNLILTAAGGSFSGGAVRLALSYVTFTPPVS